MSTAFTSGRGAMPTKKWEKQPLPQRSSTRVLTHSFFPPPVRGLARRPRSSWAAGAQLSSTEAKKASPIPWRPTK
jgi:hypothetical protein